MRRLAVALFVVIVAVSLTACGGGGSAPPAASAPAAGNPVTPPPPAGTPAANTAGASGKNETTLPVFPASGSTVPTVVADNIAAHKPMLVFFYDKSQSTTVDQRREIDEALKGYRGMITLVAFDVSKALPDPVTGKPSRDTVAQQVALLTNILGVSFTPTVFLVDKQGMTKARFRGFVDRGILEREIIKATQ